ncbi:hypothetical protein [Spirosoma koreense]
MNDIHNKFEEERLDIEKQLTQIHDEIHSATSLNLEPERIEHLQASLSGLISRCHELDKLAEFDTTIVSDQEDDSGSGEEVKSDKINTLVSECKAYMIRINTLKDGNQ